MANEVGGRLYSVLAGELKRLGGEHGYRAKVVFMSPPRSGLDRSITRWRAGDGTSVTTIKVECRMRRAEDVIADMIAGFMAANGRTGYADPANPFVREATDALRAASDRIKR